MHVAMGVKGLSTLKKKKIEKNIYKNLEYKS